MGRSPCCVQEGLNRGAWTAMEDKILTDYIQIHGEGKWRNLPKRAGLKRCGKSCRLRWLNYLRPGIKRGNITHDEEELIIRLHKLLGNRWSLIAGRLPGRTDNEIKNYWNTNIGKKLQNSKISSSNHNPLNQSQQKPNPTINKSSSSLNSEPKKVFWTKASRCSKIVNIPIASPPSMANFSGDSDGNGNKWKLNLEENYKNSSELLLDFKMDEFFSSDLLDADNFSQLSDFNYNNSNSNKNLLISNDPMQDSEFSFMDSFLIESGEFDWNIQDQVLLGNEDGEKEKYYNKN